MGEGCPLAVARRCSGPGSRRDPELAKIHSHRAVLFCFFLSFICLPACLRPPPFFVRFLRYQASVGLGAPGAPEVSPELCAGGVATQPVALASD